MKKLIPFIPFIFLAACGESPAPQQAQAQPQQVVQQQQQPQVVQQQPPQQVIVQQAPAQHSSGNDMLVGAMAGMALGHVMSNSGGGGASNNVTRNTTVINKTVVVQQAPKAAPPTPAPAARPAPVVQRTVVSSPSRSFSSGKR